MTTDDELRDVLRTVADEPAPPAKTTLQRVVQRGRRRVLLQRGATVAAVIGVVAAIGVGGVLLRSATAGQDVQPAGRLPSNEQSAPAPPPMPRLPGWRPAPFAVTHEDGRCRGVPYDGGTAADLHLPDVDTAEHRFVDALHRQIGTEIRSVDPIWQAESRPGVPPRGTIEVDTDIDGRQGFVQLIVEHFGGAVEKAADADVAMDGNCDAPQRKKLGDGTVLQVYPPTYNKYDIPLQHAAVYQPGGLYLLVTAGDISGQGEKGPSFADAGDRSRVPLDTAALAEVAEAVATLRR